MRYFRAGMRSKRVFLVGAVAGIAVLAGAAAIAWAAVGYPSDSVTVMTGCLTTSGTSAGNLGSIAVGSNPAKACGLNQMTIHLSGGTITRVAAGTGVTVSGPGSGGTGYVDNGFATVGLSSGYALPQSCNTGSIPGWSGSNWVCYGAGTGLSADTSGKTLNVSAPYRLPQSCGDKQVAKWDQTNSAWTCADDNSYTNGAGLDLSNSNEFSLKEGYQLPQNCLNGQVAASNGDNTWSCHDGGVTSGSSYSYRVESGPWDIGGFDFGDNQSTTAWCNYGDIVTGGGFYDDNTDIQYSDNAYGSGKQQGWYVDANEGAFASGHFAAFADCLHLG